MAGVGEVMRGVPVGEMCAHFSVTPKPFGVMLGSALSFSTLAFIADRCRKYDDLLSPVQWALLYYEIGLTTLETAELVLVCLFNDEAALRPFWVNYNLLVYMLSHSSAFLTNIQLTMMILDWKISGLLDDIWGLDDDEVIKYLELIIFMCPMIGLLFVMCLTHVIPGMLIYYVPYRHRLGCCSSIHFVDVRNETSRLVL